jgi:hypothetical protein
MIYVEPDSVDYKQLDDEFGKPQYLLQKNHYQEFVIPWSIVSQSVFGWNWWTQVVVSYSRNEYFSRLERIMTTFTPVETNEWAVLFEGSSALYDASHSLMAQSVCVQCFQELGRRRRRRQQQENIIVPFYAFNNGDCRLDITCHVLNGLIYLI